MIGKEVSRDHDGSHVETSRWIGKPWRRIELVVTDFYWKGERADRTWDLSFSVGFRRLGFFFHWSIARSVGFDYSDEPHQ